jgi:hypothetical protein
MTDGKCKCWHVVGVLAALALAGCQGTFTNDLATDAPADPAVNQVQVGLLGVEFQTADGNTKTLEFTAPETINLFELVQGAPLRMFTTEKLDVGQYTGVRLLFDNQTDATVTSTTGGTFPLVLEDGPFAAVDFTVADNKRTAEDLTLALDLRQSLAFDDAGQQYTLTPQLRAVSTTDAAQITGTVTAKCPSGSTLAQGGAVYVFPGSDVTPDDIDRIDAEPYATTRVEASGTTFAYTLRFLPPGHYTLALTCDGNKDAVATSDTLVFQDVQNVKLDTAETLQLDLD